MLFSGKHSRKARKISVINAVAEAHKRAGKGQNRRDGCTKMWKWLPPSPLGDTDKVPRREKL